MGQNCHRGDKENLPAVMNAAAIERPSRGKGGVPVASLPSLCGLCLMDGTYAPFKTAPTPVQ